MEPLADESIQSLKGSIIRHLQASPAGVSEYTLLQTLQAEGQLDLLPPHPSEKLKLFRRHFLVMHCLYTLQQEHPGYLEVSPLRIVYRPLASWEVPVASRAMASAGEMFLRDYYCDLGHLYEADESAVEALLQNFWQRMDSRNNETYALRKLDLREGSSWSEIKAAYRRKAQQLHPDRGGDASEFDRLRSAFEHLKRLRR